jgi:hypothetical protein
VTELLEGGSLGHALRRGTVEWRRAVEIGAAAGRTGEARSTLAAYESAAGIGYHDPNLIAEILVALGEFGRAFDCLEQACQDRSPNLTTWLNGDPRMDPIRSDPRFHNLLRRLNLA